MTEPKKWPNAAARTIAVDELIATLEKWDGTTPIFATLVATAMETSTALGYGELLTKELTAEFELIPSTPHRWASGISRPHPRLQRMFITSIARRLRQQLDDVNRIVRKT